MSTTEPTKPLDSLEPVEPVEDPPTPIRDAWSSWADRVWDMLRRVHIGAKKPGNWVQLFKFGAVGGSGYAINLVAFALLNGSAGMGHISAAIGAFLVAVTNNFAWNRIWTFREEAPGLHPAHQGARFLVVSLGGLVINLVVLELLITSAGLSELPSQAIAVAIAMPANFVGNKLWTFS